MPKKNPRIEPQDSWGHRNITWAGYIEANRRGEIIWDDSLGFRAGLVDKRPEGSGGED